MAKDPSDDRDPVPPTPASGSDTAAAEGVLDDLGRYRSVLERAFPGAVFDDDDAQLGARQAKLRRAEPSLGLERLHREPAAPETEAEREASERQAAASGQHTLYAVTARHHRSKPFTSDWAGHCQSVRVTLAATSADARSIWTWLGVVEARDHLAFSVEAIVTGYAAQFGSAPAVERVDLITGARHLGLDRFSPISVYLAYAKADDDKPIFYVLESGSAQGNPEVLYFAADMSATILAEAGFQFTPFACKANWYTGKLIMDRAGVEPSMVTISIAQERDGQRHYLDLTASYAVSEPGKGVWPVTLQIEAAMRVFALAQGMGCSLALWERALGELARAHFDWITAPPRKGSSEGYSGCSKNPAGSSCGPEAEP